MKALIFTAAAFLLSLPCFAADVPETDGIHLSLSQAQDIALHTHPRIKASDFNSDASREAINAVHANYLPQISGNAVRAFAGSNARIAATNGLNDPTVIDRGSLGVSVSQLVTDFGKTADLLQASKFDLDTKLAASRSARDRTVLAVTQAYYQVLRAQALLRVAEGTVKSSRHLSDQIRALNNAKMRSDLDLSIAEQNVRQSDLMVLKAKAAISGAMAELSEALGYAQPQTFILTDKTEASEPPGDVEALVAQALKRNPDLEAAQSEFDAAESNAATKDKEGYPVVTALAYAGDTPIRDDADRIDSRYAIAGINVSVPFYTGGRIAAQSRQAIDMASASEQTWTEKRNQIVRDVHVVFDSMATAYKNIGLMKDLLKNTERSYDLTEARYQIGKSSIVDLSESQLAETQVEIAEADARYDYFILLAQLRNLVGDSRTTE